MSFNPRVPGYEGENTPAARFVLRGRWRGGSARAIGFRRSEGRGRTVSRPRDTLSRVVEKY